jgi:hypothetical protein
MFHHCLEYFKQTSQVLLAFYHFMVMAKQIIVSLHDFVKWTKSIGASKNSSSIG